MSFVQLDDNIGDHPKMLDLSDAAFAMWVRAIAYSSKHLTDGAVPESALRRLTSHRAPKQVAMELVRAGLFDHERGSSEGPAEAEQGSSEARARVERGSSEVFRVHDYLRHNASASTVLAKREAERLRKQAAREKQGRDADGRIVSGRTEAGRPAGIPPDVRPESERSPAVRAPALLSSPLLSTPQPTAVDPPPFRRRTLEHEAAEILRVELGDRIGDIDPDHDGLALQLLSKARLDGVEVDRLAVIRMAAREVATAKPGKLTGLLHSKVIAYRDPEVLARAVAASEPKPRTPWMTKAETW